MTNRDLKSQADALAERAKHMAKRARDAKRKAVEAESSKRLDMLCTVGAYVLTYLARHPDLQDRQRLLSTLGMSDYYQKNIVDSLPEWSEKFLESNALKLDQ